MKKSRFRRIHLNRPDIGLRERLAVDSVLRSGSLAQGTQVGRFEKTFSKLLTSSNCIAVNSGTSALHLGLLALGIGRGDEVIVPSFTFAATANAVAITGATPVFVDINLSNYCVDPEAVKSAISSRTKAVIAVHLYGHPADLDQLEAICNAAGIALVEDAAQAHLAEFDGKHVGTWGEFGAFSFYPTKNMTTGEGGMVTTESLEISRRVMLLRNQGMIERYKNEIPGFNNRMSDFAAAIGLVQISKLEKWTMQRIAHAKFLDANLTGVITPLVHPQARHVFHQYTIRLVDHDREAFKKNLETKGISSDVYYPAPVHSLPAYRQALNLPSSSVASQNVLSIPVHQNLSQNDLHHIVESVNEFARAGS